MSRSKLIRASVLAIFAVVAVSASAASAAPIKYEWTVAGTPLAAGSSRTVILKDDTTIVLKGTVLGLATELNSAKVSASASSNIKGGKPGTGEGVTKFENVTVVRPKGCVVSGGELKIELTTSEIVEGASGGVGTGTVLVLFKPKTGTTFATFKYESKAGETCAIAGAEWKVTGNVLLSETSTAAAVEHLFTFDPNGSEYKNSAGATGKSGLELAEKPATLTGSIWMSLSPAETFSAL